MATRVVSLTWAQALRWRLGRLYIDPPADCDAVRIVGGLCGVQAQIPAAARLAIAVRSTAGAGSAAAVSAALANGQLVRTWAVRGTLHLLPPAVAARQLSLLADARTWQRESWQRAFLPVELMSALAESVLRALDGGPLTREELAAEIERDFDDRRVAEQVPSGWSAVLKPLAWQGVLCHGPPKGRHVTYTRPDLLLPGWTGLPDPDDAGPEVVRDYLSAYGPASIDAFDAWLLRGATPKAKLRRWFASLGVEVSPVKVEGRPALALTANLEQLAETRPNLRGVHLLPAFDQYVLGPGTRDPAIVPTEQRTRVSRPGGWISAVLLLGGRVAGIWEVTDGIPNVRAFPGVDLPAAELAAAIARMTGLLRAVDGARFQ